MRLNRDISVDLALCLLRFFLGTSATACEPRSGLEELAVELAPLLNSGALNMNPSILPKHLGAIQSASPYLTRSMRMPSQRRAI
jgi:hypothetical protein